MHLKLLACVVAFIAVKTVVGAESLWAQQAATHTVNALTTSFVAPASATVTSQCSIIHPVGICIQYDGHSQWAANAYDHNTEFVVSGQSGYEVAVMVSNSAVMTSTVGQSQIAVLGIHPELGQKGPVLSGKALNGPGELRFTVGAEIPIQAELLAGTYSGSFAVTINYN